MMRRKKKQSRRYTDFWNRLGVDEGGLPVHLPIEVNEQGQGPEDRAIAHHTECWCGGPDCPLGRALLEAGRLARRQAMVPYSVAARIAQEVTQ